MLQEKVKKCDKQVTSFLKKLLDRDKNSQGLISKDFQAIQTSYLQIKLKMAMKLAEDAKLKLPNYQV